MKEPIPLLPVDSDSQEVEKTPTGTWAEVVLEQSDDGVIVTDLEGRITYVNPAQADQLGYTREELTGRPWRVFFPSQEAESARLCEGLWLLLGEGKGGMEPCNSGLKTEISSRSIYACFSCVAPTASRRP